MGPSQLQIPQPHCVVVASEHCNVESLTFFFTEYVNCIYC